MAVGRGGGGRSIAEVHWAETFTWVLRKKGQIKAVGNMLSLGDQENVNSEQVCKWNKMSIGFRSFWVLEQIGLFCGHVWCNRVWLRLGGEATGLEMKNM